jgi:hypothetical protein
MSNPSGEMSVKLIMFLGKQVDLDDWFFGFESCAAIFRYEDILNGTTPVPKVSEINAMKNIRKINSPIQVGTGDAVECTKVRDKSVRIVQEDGAVKDIVLKECKYVPDLFTNLFSITKALDNGWNILNKGINISLDKDDFNFCFDKTLRMDSGAITAVEMVPKLDTMHVTLEHTLRKTAKEYGLILKGNYMVCTDCAMSKAHQKNVDKVSGTVSTKPGERLYIDISSCKATSVGGAKFWLLIVDQFTDLCWSAFLVKKSDLGTIIRCDNAGENLALQKLMLDRVR